MFKIRQDEILKVTSPVQKFYVVNKSDNTDILLLLMPERERIQRSLFRNILKAIQNHLLNYPNEKYS